MDTQTGNHVAADHRIGRPVLALIFLTATVYAFMALGSTAKAAGPYLVDASTISAGYTHTCAIRKADPTDHAGQAVCWGNGDGGRLGNGTDIGSGVPLAVKQVGWTGTSPDNGLLDDAVAISAGDYHSCAIRLGGQVVCWGSNEYGQLGSGLPMGSFSSRSLVPVPVRQPDWTGVAPHDGLLENAIAISTGQSHACAIRTGGQAVCWGSNISGQLGDGTTTARNTPTPVTALNDATEISTGYAHSCAIRQGGQALCWGQTNMARSGTERPRTAAHQPR